MISPPSSQQQRQFDFNVKVDFVSGNVSLTAPLTFQKQTNSTFTYGVTQPKMINSPIISNTNHTLNGSQVESEYIEAVNCVICGKTYQKEQFELHLNMHRNRGVSNNNNIVKLVQQPPNIASRNYSQQSLQQSQYTFQPVKNQNFLPTVTQKNLNGERPINKDPSILNQSRSSYSSQNSHSQPPVRLSYPSNSPSIHSYHTFSQQRQNSLEYSRDSFQSQGSSNPHQSTSNYFPIYSQREEILAFPQSHPQSQSHPHPQNLSVQSLGHRQVVYYPNYSQRQQISIPSSSINVPQSQQQIDIKKSSETQLKSQEQKSRRQNQDLNNNGLKQSKFTQQHFKSIRLRQFQQNSDSSSDEQNVTQKPIIQRMSVTDLYTYKSMNLKQSNASQESQKSRMNKTKIPVNYLAREQFISSSQSSKAQI